MKSAIIRTVIPKDHRLQVDVPTEIPAGPAEVVVRSVTELGEACGTGADLLASGLFGLWKDRTDIADSVAFARRLRQEAESRHRG